MKKVFYFLLFVVLIAVITNPDIDQHKEFVKQSLIQKHIYDKDTNRTFDDLFTVLFGVGYDELIHNLVSRENYVLFSISHVTVRGEKKLFGFGIFGNVFLIVDVENKIYNQRMENEYIIWDE